MCFKAWFPYNRPGRLNRSVALIELNVQIYADSVGWLPYNRLDRLDRPSPLKMCSGNGHDHLELTASITDATLLGRLQSPG